MAFRSMPARTGRRKCVATLPALTPLRLDGRREDGIWIHGLTADSKEGWLRRSLVDLNFDIGLLTVMNVEGLDTGTEVVQARVLESAGGLRLRQLPGDDGRVMVNLNAGTELTIEGRTADNGWLLVKSAEGYEGWVASNFVELYVDLADVDAIDNPQPVKFVVPPTPEGGVNVVSSVGGGARADLPEWTGGGQPAQRLQQSRRQPDRYAQLPARAWRQLQPARLRLPAARDPVLLQRQRARRQSVRQRLDFGARFVGDGQRARSRFCRSGALQQRRNAGRLRDARRQACRRADHDRHERLARLSRPISFGERLRQIVETCIQDNVVPILSTLPPRAQYNDNIIAYNQVITSMAQQLRRPADRPVQRAGQSAQSRLRRRRDSSLRAARRRRRRRSISRRTICNTARPCAT